MTLKEISKSFILSLVSFAERYQVLVCTGKNGGSFFDKLVTFKFHFKKIQRHKLLWTFSICLQLPFMGEPVSSSVPTCCCLSFTEWYHRIQILCGVKCRTRSQIEEGYLLVDTSLVFELFNVRRSFILIYWSQSEEIKLFPYSFCYCEELNRLFTISLGGNDAYLICHL